MKKSAKFRRNQKEHNLVIEAVLVIIIIMLLKQMLDRRKFLVRLQLLAGCHGLA